MSLNEFENQYFNDKNDKETSYNRDLSFKKEPIVRIYVDGYYVIKRKGQWRDHSKMKYNDKDPKIFTKSGCHCYYCTRKKEANISKKYGRNLKID